MKTLVIAHRGASGYHPEHTEAAYRAAVELGADAVEPDLVATRDGMLVVRHENEISGTTDVASRPEFADRRRRGTVDGQELTGWFTEDFTWAELATLRARERLPELRPGGAAADGRHPLLRLTDLFALLADATTAAGEPVRMVAEIKHATHFDAIGLPLAPLFLDALAASGWPSDRVVVESFEKTVLDRLHAGGLRSKRVYLAEAEGTAADLVAAQGSSAPTYTEELSPAGLARLAQRDAPLDGVSVNKAVLLGSIDGGRSTLVDDAHAAGLGVFTWTLRPENAFLAEPFRTGPADRYGDWRGEFERVIGTGVDGVFADHPDLAVTARAAVQQRRARS